MKTNQNYYDVSKLTQKKVKNTLKYDDLYNLQPGEISRKTVELWNRARDVENYADTNDFWCQVYEELTPEVMEEKGVTSLADSDIDLTLVHEKAVDFLVRALRWEGISVI